MPIVARTTSRITAVTRDAEEVCSEEVGEVWLAGAEEVWLAGAEEVWLAGAEAVSYTHLRAHET